MWSPEEHVTYCIAGFTSIIRFLLPQILTQAIFVIFVYDLRHNISYDILRIFLRFKKFFFVMKCTFLCIFFLIGTSGIEPISRNMFWWNPWRNRWRNYGRNFKESPGENQGLLKKCRDMQRRLLHSFPTFIVSCLLRGVSKKKKLPTLVVSAEIPPKMPAVIPSKIYTRIIQKFAYNAPPPLCRE